MGNNTKKSNVKKWLETHTPIEQQTNEQYDIIWLNRLGSKIHDWVYSGYKSIDYYLNNDQIKYIQGKMTPADKSKDVENGQLTRVESAYHFEEMNIKEGDLIKSQNVFRAYSRTRQATAEYMAQDKAGHVVIYRTNGGVNHFDISEYAGSFRHEKESWVEQGKLRVQKITEYNGIDNVKKLLTDEFQVDTNKINHHWVDITDITLVDVAPV